jgi:hypothetical protein
MREPKRLLFTEAALAALMRNGRPQRQTVVWDTKERGLCVLVSRGPKHKRQATVTFRVIYYLKDRPGEARYVKLGRYPDELSDLDDVRDRARLVRIDAKNGIDPRKPKLTGTLADTVERYIETYAKDSRTWAESARILRRYVVAEWADKNIESVTKEDVSTLLTKIRRGKLEIGGKPRGTPAVARATRSQLVTLFNWYEVNHTVGRDFRMPIPRLMKNDALKVVSVRERHLDDDEIRALWTACGDLGIYGALVKTALLTAQRFRKVGQMRRSDLKQHFRLHGDDVGHVWDPSREDDPKNKRVSLVPLSDMARTVLAAVPIIAASKPQDFVFSHNGTTPLKGWSLNKARLDKKMLALMRQSAAERGDDPSTVTLKPWQARDLRRTARTLLARLKIPSDVAEHCLAHVLPGVQQIYNRHDYLVEKREAFQQLAELIQRIANPSSDNVVALPHGGSHG